MPKRAEDLQKHTLHLYSGDFREIQERFPDVGAAVVIRKIVRQFLLRQDEKLTKAKVPLETLDV